MNKTALITGILGQDGPYLAQHLLQQGYVVYGLIRPHVTPRFDNTDYLGITRDIQFITGDLNDEASIISVIKTSQPDEVYNLAAQSFVGDSWHLAKLTTDINALGVLYILNAIKLFRPTTKFYQASTSEMFGNNHKFHIQDESITFTPRSPYGVAKLYAYWMTVNFRESYQMHTTNGILFNHESPIRGLQFVTRKISDGVARIKYGLQTELFLGNLDAKRDWGFAGDYVKAMHAMMQLETPDDFCVATGETHSVREFCQLAFEYAGLGNYEQYVKLDPRYNRPAELHALCGSSEKARSKLGWKPEVSFPDLVKMMTDADLKRIHDKQH